MSETSHGESRGLLASLSTFAATLVAIAHTRLELLSSDLEEDRAHLVSLLVYSLVALFCLGVGVVLAAILLVVVFWDSHRLLVLAALAGGFLVAGVVAQSRVRDMAKRKPRIFSASMAELLKDRQHLASRP
jgi:uncharacterized membrane protein YqjE